MSDSVYKRCKCRDESGKDFGAKCPKLKRADQTWNPHHGTWYFALELPPGPGGKRRPRMRRGGFASSKDAEAARENAKATLRKGVDPSVKILVGDYLTRWLKGRKDLKPTTRHNYTISVNTYLVPLLGHIELPRLQPEDIADALDTIREWNDLLAQGRPVRKFQRHVGPVAMARVLTPLQAALRDAMKSRLVEFNAAKLVSMESSPSYKPALWTGERVRQFWIRYDEALEADTSTRGDRAFLVWRRLSLRPFPVMLWQRNAIGAFLDYCAGHRMLPLFELAAATGMRRGELAGLPWSDVDLDEGVLHVTKARVQAGWEVVPGGPKTEAGHREIALLPEDVDVLKAWRRQQHRERLQWGGDWKDCGLVFTKEDGSPWHPDTITDTFERLAFAAHLPPIRLHDVRHFNISEMFAAGIDARIISERVGHSGSKMTRDYAAVAAEVSRQAAAKVAAAIPRAARQ